MKRNNKDEGNFISFKVLLTPDGKIVSEISSFPPEKVDSIFAEHDKKIIKTLIERADAKLKPLHLYLQREIQAL